MRGQILLCDMVRVKLQELQQTNKSYSLRALAKKLEISPTTLSMVLNGKREISLKMAEKICDNLKIPVNERGELLSCFSSKKKDVLKIRDQIVSHPEVKEKLMMWQKELHQMIKDVDQSIEVVDLSLELFLIGPRSLKKEEVSNSLTAHNY